KSSVKLKDVITTIITTRTPLAIEAGTFNTAFKDIVIMIKEKPSVDSLSGIFIYDGRNKNEPGVLMAKEGKIFVSEGLDTSIYLKDGYIHIARGNSTTELFFEKYNLLLRLETDAPSKKNAELTPFELIKEAKHAEASRAVSLQLEFHRRLSLPLLCVILIFFGPPLALMAGKSGKLGGLALGLAVFTVYYVILIYGENLVRAGKLPHYIGAWSPTVILGIFALLIFKRESSK
ncbi:MAG: LptF/LptG family permease, partial [Nitrospirota bacterium]|nr:LptF/LptG family permease [Nitrospirota bacterium]